MSLAARLSALFVALAFFMACIATGMAAYREYRTTLDDLTENTSALVLSRPDLQWHVYGRNEERLGQVLGDFLELPAIRAVAVYDGLGEQLADRFDADTTARRLPPLEKVRGDRSTTDTVLVGLDERGKPTGTGLLSSYFNSDTLLHLSIPIFSAFNPGQRGLGEQDFGAALAAPRGASRFVVGYLQAGVGRGALLDAIRPGVGRIFLIGIAFTLLCGAAALYMNRRITAPLSQLARLADDVASGQLKKPVEIEGTGEIREIAHVLNSVIGGLTSYKKEMDVGNQLLNMKVEERTSQLSLRDEELSRAAEEVTETRNKLRQMSYYDTLTSLPNRRLFTEQLELLLRLSQRNGQPLALLFVDLDNFNRVNESLGHSAGDLFLRQVGQRLTECVRESDTVAHCVEAGSRIDVSRLGGDEFTVVLNQLDSPESAGVVAQRIIDALAEPVVIDGHELVVTPSVGIAIAPRDARDVEGLLRAAGTAMYHAKGSSTEDFLFYEGKMGRNGVERIRLEADLRKAIERGQLLLHYQPQVDTLSGSIAGAEALLRWEHPEHGLVPPYTFVGIAEEIGLIRELGDWVLVEACRQMKAFTEAGLKLPRMAVNVSALQFSPDFAGRVREILQEAGLEPCALELGLTEEIMADTGNGIREVLGDLKELGVYLSVDDFGTRHAPLDYLGSHPLDELKIDRRFVAGCGREGRGANLVAAIIALAESLNLRVVAEGVETPAQFHFLSDSGAHVMQGYLFSEPVPPDQLQQMLAPWHFLEQIQGVSAAGAA
ncbi:MAG: EAL domain-containing protein [Halioglobus sp.]